MRLNVPFSRASERPNRPVHLVLMAFMFVFFPAAAAHAQLAIDPTLNGADLSNAEDDASILLKDIQPYRMAIEDGSKVFELKTQPVLNWTNPAFRDQKGAVYVWMSEGRPQVIAAPFHHRPEGAEKRIHELHSLSDAPFRVSYDGDEVWAPRQPFRLTPFPSAQPPAGTASARLLQMRRLARRFKAQMTREDGDVMELRLISRPLLVYAPQSPTCTDGAIFSFAAAGTDPDAFLLIENRKVDGQPKWHYGLARFHFNGLKSQLDGDEIWEANADRDMLRNYHGSRNYYDDNYIIFRTY